MTGDGIWAHLKMSSGDSNVQQPLQTTDLTELKLLMEMRIM